MRQFTPKEPFSAKADELIHRFATENTCSVHVRGGDIKPLSIKYYKDALNKIGEQKKDMRFIVFSNVRNLAEEYIKELGVDAEFIWDLGEFTDIEELFLMKACRRHILSDSTFSRWAALLDEKSEEVFVPFSPDADKIYMPEWIMEEYDGNEEKR